MTDHPSIAVVVLDTLREDIFRSLFDWLPGMRFTNAYSTSHWTVPAHGSLFTGLYPSEIGVHSRSQTLDCENPTISEVLNEEGFDTTKYSANLNIHAWEGWNRGFDTNIGPDDLTSPFNVDTVDFTEFKSNSGHTGLQLYLASVLRCFKDDSSTIFSLLEGVRQVLESYDRGGSKAVTRKVQQESFEQNHFLFVNLMESHSPYFPPEDYRRLDKSVSPKSWESFLDGISNLEDIEIAYEDSAKYLSDNYKELFKELSNEFDYVITLSDHGEMLGEYGMVDHVSGLYPELTKIPIVISGEDIRNTTVQEAVSILDVHATIADIAGVDVGSRGQSLLMEIEPQDRLVEYHGLPSWLRETYIQKGVSNEIYESLNENRYGFVGSDGEYSFETSTGELKVTADSQISACNRRSRMNDLIANLNKREVKESNSEPDDAVLSRLEDLGYA
ncbi:sulfatase-like hydrolase/transferase [Natrinema sp. H-ect1]|uniref:sulfatase-like hydrolase/transferase n=1 Tax=Natrinema sp. H-ect1 TaxID=3242700 RepID=UPI00359D540A